MSEEDSDVDIGQLVSEQQNFTMSMFREYLHWIRSKDVRAKIKAPPVSVEAYGQGKTGFTDNLAASLAETDVSPQKEPALGNGCDVLMNRPAAEANLVASAD